MVHIKKFNEINENFNENFVDLDLLQGVIDNMRPGRKSKIKDKIIELNNKYNCKEQKKLPSTFGKKVADWIDLNLIQDIIDRMNPNLCDKNDEYKKDLKDIIEKEFLNN